MDGTIVIGTELDTKSFDAQIEYVESQLQDIEDKLKQADMGFEVGDTQKLEAQYESLINKLQRLRKEQDKLNSQGFSNMRLAVNEVGKGIEKTVKKVKRWALAIFGVRSAYMMIRSAMNTISSNDEQLKADIDYIKGAIAYTLEPVVRGIVNMIKQLLMYIGYIVKVWTGKNIFENANKSLKNANKQAKELHKTTTKFDEMEILQDNKGASAGTATPSFDLANLDNVKMPGWVEFIAKNGQAIVAVVLAIGSALEMIKISKFLKELKLVKNTLKATTALGIGTIIAGVAMAIQDIVGFIKDPSWQGFLNILTDVGVVIGGIIMLTNPLLGILVALGSLILKLVINNWDAIVDVLSNVAKWIYDKIIKPIADFFVWLWGVIITGLSIAWDFIKGIFSAFAGWIYDNVIKPVADLFTDLWDGIKNTFVKTWDFIVGAFSKGGKIFKGIGEGILNVFKTIVNALIDGINFVISLPFKGINGLLNTIRNAGILGVHPFKGLWEQDPVPVPKIPKLAKGAIASYPGRGIPTVGGGAKWGEAGQEAYLPLTDAQVMSSLGEAIGRNVTIPVTVINQMNGRTISRQLQIVKSNSDFAFNR